ncbi:aminoacyl-tRNA hydrolase, partial [Xanthomonas citri pv. citri]|nr:aminoacyl-tRNA hydrolase [Xanthomonas citri pv. citri]
SKFKTNDFKRIRVGIGASNNLSIKDYVLSLFSKEEMLIIEEVLEKVADAAISLVYNDINYVTSKFNTDNKKRVI